MINITKEQLEYLKKHIPDIDNVIKNDNLEILLDIIDDQIIDNILGNNDEPDEVGIKIQRIYDQIYNQNE